MSQFEELLRNSVLGVGQAYSVAENDLLEEVAVASEAVAKVSNGLGVLELKKTGNDASGTVFTMYVVTKDNLHEIAGFAVSPSGYPIKVATRQEYLGLQIFEAVLNARQEVNKYLTDAMSNPDSRLVLRVAFLLRQ